ncbi:MAG: glutathione S-transferase family protein [Polyangiales bacterium]
MPTLYSHPLSTYAQRVHIALLEKGVTWDVEQVDMGKKQHRSPEYLAINPYGRVPALVDGALKLVESSAILDYLEATHPTPPLLPEGAEGRAEVHMHVKLCDLQFAGHVGVLIFPKRFLPEDRWQRDLMAQASKQIARHFAILDAHLAQREWLVGGAFSIADIAYAPFLQFLDMVEVDAPPHVRDYAERLLARPSVVATRPADAPSRAS